MTAPTNPYEDLEITWDGPQFDPNNVIVGPAAMYLRPYEKGVSAKSLLPPNEQPLWTPWQREDPAWFPIGMTKEGVTMAFSRSTQELTGEEQSAPVVITSESTAWNLNTVMIEDRIETIMYAFGGGTITEVAATATESGYEDLEVSEDMVNLCVGLEGLNEHGKPRRVIVPKTVSAADIEIAHRRAANYREYETSFKSMCRAKDVAIRNVKSDPTGP